MDYKKLTNLMFHVESMQLCENTGFVFDKDGFIQRLDFFVRVSLLHNDFNTKLHGLFVCQQQYILAFSAFCGASFSCRYKGVYSNGTADSDLLDSYTKLCAVGINQFLMKLMELQNTKGIKPEDHFVKANTIIIEGVAALADDVEDLFKNHANATNKS